jgi:hypothetical protein
MQQVEFSFDHAELNRLARDRWGIRHPVIVRRRTRRWVDGRPSVRRDQGGRVAWRPELREHHVLLVNVPCVETMLRTLAHELAHCGQAERMGPSIFTGLSDDRRFPGRRQRWCLYLTDEAGFEKLAREDEERWEELLPAVRLKRRNPA